MIFILLLNLQFGAGLSEDSSSLLPRASAGAAQMLRTRITQRLIYLLFLEIDADSCLEPYLGLLTRTPTCSDSLSQHGGWIFRVGWGGDERAPYDLWPRLGRHAASILPHSIHWHDQQNPVHHLMEKRWGSERPCEIRNNALAILECKIYYSRSFLS